jgi:drug/metabolite transporter (DMT)-like permease
MLPYLAGECNGWAAGFSATRSPTVAPSGGELSEDRRTAVVGIGMYLLAAMLFAFNGSVSKAVMNAGLDPVAITELRNAGAMVVLFMYILLRNPGSMRVHKGEWLFLIAYGVLAFAVVQFLYFFTISRLPVGIGTLLAFLAPIVVALWIRFGRKQPVRARLWYAIGFTLVGLALVAQVPPGTTIDVVGVIAGLLLAITLSLYWLLGEAGQKTRDPLSLTMWGFVFATVAWSVMAPWWNFPWAALNDPSVPLRPDWPAFPVWSLMIWVVLLGTIAPFLLVLGSLKRIGAQRAGIVGTTEPLWAFLLAFIFLGETITGIQILGAFVVLAGVVIAETARKPKRGEALPEFLPNHP